MASEHAHAAVVFAAGGSRRLGRPKQFLCREGETLLHRAVRLAQETEPSRVLVVLGAHRDEARAALRNLPCAVLDNAEWEQGLSSSLRVAQRALADEPGPLLLLGCDQPALQRSHLLALLQAAEHAPSGCAATGYENAFGLPAVITMALLQSAETLDGDRGLRAPLQALGREQVRVLAAPELELDVDTPEDLERAIDRGWVDRG